MSEPGTGGTVAGRDRRGPVILVTSAAAATGSKAAAAALACAASEPDRAALLIDLDRGRAPRPSLVATTGARALEERLVAHLPDAAIASRGRFCRLMLSADPGEVAQIVVALPLVRESAGVVHLPPRLLRPVLEETRVRPTAALLRADLAQDRALTALVVRDLMARGLHVAVLKSPLGRLAAGAALLGALPEGRSMLPRRLVDRLFGEASSSPPQPGDGGRHDSDAEPGRAPQQERRDHAGPRRRRGLHRDSQRSTGR